MTSLRKDAGEATATGSAGLLTRVAEPNGECVNLPALPLNTIAREAEPWEKELVRIKLGKATPIPEDATDWSDRQVWVLEENGVICGCVCARQVWQVEPLYLFPEFAAEAGPVTIRRAVFKLIRAAEGWLRSQKARWYFSYIERKPMQRAAKDYGMVAVYRKGRLFGKEL